MSPALSKLVESSLSLVSVWSSLCSRYTAAGSLGLLVYYTLHRLFLWPYCFSPLRHVPGPPLGHVIYGQSAVLVNSETGIPQREWVKMYGPVIRVVGPVGLERLLFTKPDALHQILVKDWLEYPRMRKAMNPAFSQPNLMAQTQMYYEAIYGFVPSLVPTLNSTRTNDASQLSRILKKEISTEIRYTNPHNELATAYEHLIGLQNGPNMAKLIMTVSLPGGRALLASEWAYRHRTGLIKSSFLYLLFFQKFDIPIKGHLGTLVESMHAIRIISSNMLKEKMNDAELMLADIDAKRDIMSILVRARKAEMDGGKGGYAMSDRAMMDQVLTFLGAGHETTASGLTWVQYLFIHHRNA
ncbi:cytochrome P450 [Cyathus striatus]|nr:cytochrome P450 [Cyathus striatus]